EVRELDGDVRTFSLEPFAEYGKQSRQRSHRHFAAMLVEHLDEAAHVRALELRRQVDGHREFGHCLLAALRAVQHDDRVAEAGNTHAIDRDAAWIVLALDVTNRHSSSPS